MVLRLVLLLFLLGLAQGKDIIHILYNIINLITVFELHLGISGRNYRVCMRIRRQITFSKFEFTQFVNRNFKILGRRRSAY